METIGEFIYGKKKDPNAPKEPTPPENQIPFEMYTFAFHSCFDSCIT